MLTFKESHSQQYATQRQYGAAPGFSLWMSSQIGSGCWGLGDPCSDIFTKLSKGLVYMFGLNEQISNFGSQMLNTF